VVTGSALRHGHFENAAQDRGLSPPPLPSHFTPACASVLSFDGLGTALPFRSYGRRHSERDTRWEPEDEYSASLIGTFVPGYLRCRVCDLELDGEDELRIAGVPDSWELDYVNPGDFYGPDDF
jgi:hypothetical protein